jgi:hypothetical protein
VPVRFSGVLTYGILRLVRFVPSRRVVGERTPMPVGFGALAWLVIGIPFLLVAGLAQLIVAGVGGSAHFAHDVGLAVLLYPPALAVWLGLRYVVNADDDNCVLVWDEIIAGLIAAGTTVLWR